MKELKPVLPKIIDGKRYFNPYNNKFKSKKPVCICGYELIQEDERTFKCSGGNHRYIMDKEDIIKDKFGQIWIKKPVNPGENNKNE